MSRCLAGIWLGVNGLLLAACSGNLEPSPPAQGSPPPSATAAPSTPPPAPTSSSTDRGTDNVPIANPQPTATVAPTASNPPPAPTQAPPSDCPPWPAATGTRNVSASIAVSGTFDGQLARFVGTGPLGNGSQAEGQDALFELAAGATLKNVILGNPAADGIHCAGACTLENVWWENVGEDAATFRGNSNTQAMRVICGGARGADDKVFQHNGAGTLTIENFLVEDFGKLYRSCGNCSTQFERHVVFRHITASGGGVLAGINENFGDSAEFEDITIDGDVDICDRFDGNDTGAEPTRVGSGPDTEFCLYSDSDITRN
jgi:pectate lyase